MNQNVKSIFVLLLLSLWFLPGRGFSQELATALEAWEKHELDRQKEDHAVEYLVSARNKYQIGTGRHYFCREKSGELSWYHGNNTDDAEAVHCRNDEYCFVLGRDDEKPLVIASLQFNNGEEPLVTVASLQHASCGASRGFHFIPSFDVTLGGLNKAKDILVQESVSQVDENSIEIKFSVNRELGKKLYAAGKASHAVVALLGRGVRTGVIIVEKSSNRIQKFQIEMEYLRDPITKEVIQAVNRAGQRRPDGSLFPLDDAEPPGVKILTKQQVECRWAYENGKLSEFEIVDNGDEEVTTAAEPYRVTDIQEVEVEPANRLSDYGFSEPKKGNSNEPSKPDTSAGQSGYPFYFQLALLGGGALALLASIAIKRQSRIG